MSLLPFLSGEDSRLSILIVPFLSVADALPSSLLVLFGLPVLEGTFVACAAL
jgi:hypothetical protein